MKMIVNLSNWLYQSLLRVIQISNMNIIIKTPEQIEGIRKSSKLAGDVLLYIAEFVKEGVTTNFLDQLIHNYIIEHGLARAKDGADTGKGDGAGACVEGSAIGEVSVHVYSMAERIELAGRYSQVAGGGDVIRQCP